MIVLKGSEAQARAEGRYPPRDVNGPFVYEDDLPKNAVVSLWLPLAMVVGSLALGTGIIVAAFCRKLGWC